MQIKTYLFQKAIKLVYKILKNGLIKSGMKKILRKKIKIRFKMC